MGRDRYTKSVKLANNVCEVWWTAGALVRRGMGKGAQVSKHGHQGRKRDGGSQATE
jgi:hypothetical protein